MPMPTLHVLKGTNEGAFLPLDGDKFILGRNPDCAINIAATSVSREHAQILRINGRYYIEDKQSRNGTFERVFDRLKPQAFQACFREWVQAISAALRIKHIAIDGKTLRGSGSAKLGPLHLVSAWATAQHLSLGQVAVDAKSNEITAIPVLLELLDLNGALVTIDAMGCQKAIAQKIVDQGGHYALTVKDNQEHLLEDIRESFLKAFDTEFAGLDHDEYETRQRGHGREEYRSYTVLHSTEGIRHAEAWAGLTTIGLCFSERTVKGKSTTECRFFIGDKKASAKYYAGGLRHHWGIENNLHWQLDVNFAEDGNRVQKRNAAENLARKRSRIEVDKRTVRRRGSQSDLALSQLGL